MGEVEVALDAVALSVIPTFPSLRAARGAAALPAVYGHEAAGRVSAVGDGVNAVWPLAISVDRHTDPCLWHLPQSCAGGKPVRFARRPMVSGPLTKGPSPRLKAALLHQAMATGGFAEKVVVDQRQVGETIRR